MYKDTIYVLGESRTNSDNAITAQFNSFFVGLVVRVETDEIVDFGCSHTIEVTEKFLRSIFLGKNMLTDLNKIENEIKRRYFGSSQKAILVSCKEAFRQYREIKQKYY